MTSVTKVHVREFLVTAVVLAVAALAYGDSAIDLTNGVPVSGLSGATGSQVYYRIAVPAGQGELTISISGGIGDCDLYVKRGSLPSTWNYDYRPYHYGNNESVTISYPASDDWYIMLRANAAYSDVTLVASYDLPVATALTNGVSRTGISGHDHTLRLYTIEVPAGQASLEVNTWGGLGDVDLFVKLGSAPTPDDADAESTGSGTTESVALTDPAAGTWYIALYGSQDYDDVTLRALYGAGGPVSEGEENETIDDLSGAAGSETYYVFHVPYNVESISFVLSGGIGDCDMYIKHGAKPTMSDYDYRPSDNGNSESVSFSGDIESGDWYVLLVGDEAYADVTLKVRYYYRSPKPQPKPPEPKPPEGKVTPLMSGVAIPDLAGKAGSELYFSIEVPSGASNLIIKISGGTGDADLYVRKGALPTTADYDHRPYLTGNNEQVTISKPAAGIWYILVRGYQSFDGVTLLATFDGLHPDDVVLLQNGIPITGLAGGPGSERFFKIEVPAGQSRLEIVMSGGIGDADLYIRFGAKPTTRDWDWRPYLFGNKESGTTDNPKAGTYYIMIRGYLAYTDVTLQATYGPAVDPVKALKSCVPMEGLSGAQGSEVFFKIEVPAGRASLRIALSGGTGDADLYIKKGEKPTTKSFDYHPGLHGNDETVEVLNPAAATWYVMVQGYQAFSGVTLKACVLAAHDGCDTCGGGCDHSDGCDSCGDHHCGDHDDCDPEDGCWIIYF
jgi:hypothetical protein